MKAKVHRARPKDDHQFDIVTLRIWKGNTHSSICKTSNNTGDGSVSQMDRLLSEALIHLEKCSQSKSIQVRPAILRYNFKNHCFLGLWFSIALVHVFISWVFISLGFMHSCMLKNTTFHECSKIFISLYFKANFIRLALHSRMFKNTTFHEWDFS